MPPNEDTAPERSDQEVFAAILSTRASLDVLPLEAKERAGLVSTLGELESLRQQRIRLRLETAARSASLVEYRPDLDGGSRHAERAQRRRVLENVCLGMGVPYDAAAGVDLAYERDYHRELDRMEVLGDILERFDERARIAAESRLRGLDVAERLKLALELIAQYGNLSEEVAARLKQLLEPQNLAIFIGFLTLMLTASTNPVVAGVAAAALVVWLGSLAILLGRALYNICFGETVEDFELGVTQLRDFCAQALADLIAYAVTAGLLKTRPGRAIARGLQRIAGGIGAGIRARFGLTPPVVEIPPEPVGPPQRARGGLFWPPEPPVEPPVGGGRRPPGELVWPPSEPLPPAPVEPPIHMKPPIEAPEPFRPRSPSAPGPEGDLVGAGAQGSRGGRARVLVGEGTRGMAEPPGRGYQPGGPRRGPGGGGGRRGGNYGGRRTGGGGWGWEEGPFEGESWRPLRPTRNDPPFREPQGPGRTIGEPRTPRPPGMPEQVGSPRQRPPGYNDPWRGIVNRLLEDLGGMREGMRLRLLEALQHAEGQAAAWLRGSALEEMVLDLNNTPCPDCLQWLWRLLRPGQILVLRFRTSLGVVQIIIEGGVPGWIAGLVY